MKRSITRWTTAAAAAALLALPATGWAQTGTSGQQPPTTTTGTQAEERDARPDDAAKEHLREARTALNRIENKELTGEAQQKVAELKRHFSSLERAVGEGDQASATGAAQRTEPAEPRGSANWQTEVAAIDRLLNDLIGPEQGTAGAVGTTGATSATGATGTTGAARAAVTLTDSTRDALADVRKHVTKFSAKMSNTDATPRQDDSVATTTDTAATGTTTAQSGTATSSTTATGTTDTTSAQAAVEGQATVQAARRHLTDARNTLSELTQLPQAAQLTGEARTQVSQLIANFNELITTDQNWRESYAKVDANLDALLGPGSMTGTATIGTTGTGTTGTVGTTGAATAIELDPEVREKLVEIRTKLNEFERAAGGNAEPASTDPATAGAPTGAMTGTATGTATATTTDPAQAQATAQDPQAQTPAAPAGHMDQAEIMRHIEAIEAILNANDPMSATGAPGTTGAATGTAGTVATTGVPTPPPSGAASSMAGEAVTLSRAQVEQLRLHLNQVRGLVQR